MDNNIDHLFKKAFEEQRCEPPEQVWNHIEEHLASCGGQRRIWWLRSVAAAAIIAGILGIWQFPQQAQHKNIYFTEQTMVLPADTSSGILFPPGKIGPKKLEAGITAPVISVSSQPLPTRKKESRAQRRDCEPLTIRKPKHPAILNHSQVESELITRNLKQTEIPLTSGEALQNNREYLALLDINTAQQQTEKKKILFALSGYFVPAYSSGSYSSTVKNPRGYDYSKDQMEGLMNTGGGLKLAVGYGKRLAFQTGIFYSRMGQKSTGNYGRARVTAYALSSTENRVSTPLGNIKTHRKAIAYRSEEAVLLSQISSSHADEAIEQVFDALEIPLKIKYQLNNNKILFSLNGGFSGNFIIDNKVYLKSGSHKELLGSTEDIRNFNISTDWGLGIEYPLGHKVKIMIEPGFKYYLQSLSRNENIDFKPYMFSLATGIGIDF